MSLFGAMNTAISGLNAQSVAFGNISDNVANSQTIGFKRIDTSFIDYLTSSSALSNSPGSVQARPDYRNSIQGTIAQSENPLAMGIVGQGFFAVSRAETVGSGSVIFSPQSFYSRAGDFQMDRNGFLVNSAGDYLNGWAVNPLNGVVDRSSVNPIRVTQTVYNPQPTSEVSLSANLPATPTGTAPVSAQISVYDALGRDHVVTLDWTRTAANDWTVAVNVPDDIASTSRGTARVAFGPTASGNPVPQGTVGVVGNATGSVTAGAYAANTPATLSFDVDFGSGIQAITLNLGTYGLSGGMTQYAGTDFNLRGISQNGVPPGAFAGVATTQSGDVQVTYDNGQSRTIARVPVITFNDPDSLQRQDGQAFTATLASGDPLTQDARTNGAGGIVTNSLENSNVDIATEFTRLIVAQRAYSANTKMVTTADELLQQTLDMKR
ncbi:MAG: flagellar hook protein FlgE [Acetobacteraceae bacterium]|nr:flagellar hook protein FlgE [Acetobacteraceae bacterium]